ncbi:MAG: LuxR C-terminal-related transcriptional regulator [Chloroflexi bacterium]|nr:LuxR C-terminal-related transcriptional regulator [Chloroflexota bacterium]
MSMWRFFISWWSGLRKGAGKKYTYVAGHPFDLELTQPVARHEDDQQASDSHPAAPRTDKVYQSWQKLSRREQDVTALTCLRYTNPQIAARLGLSVGTVRSYLDKVLSKLGLQNKADLRVFFAAWDFKEFERRKDPYR